MAAQPLTTLVSSSSLVVGRASAEIDNPMGPIRYVHGSVKLNDGPGKDDTILTRGSAGVLIRRHLSPVDVDRLLDAMRALPTDLTLAQAVERLGYPCEEVAVTTQVVNLVATGGNHVMQYDLPQIIDFEDKGTFVISAFDGTNEMMCSYFGEGDRVPELALLLNAHEGHPFATYALRALGAKLERLPMALRNDVPAAAALAAERRVQLVRCFWPAGGESAQLPPAPTEE